MPQITMLSDEERTAIREKLNRYVTIDIPEGDNLTHLLTEMDVAEGDVEVRFFPQGPTENAERGPVERLYFEVIIDRDAEWSEEDRMGSYSASHLADGGPMYEALDEELRNIVKEMTGTFPSFVKKKGSGAYTAEVEV